MDTAKSVITDQTVKAQDAGSVIVAYTATDFYSSFSGEFSIPAQYIPVAGFTKEIPTEILPDMEYELPQVTFSWDKSSFTNADTYTVTATAKGDYNATKVQTFTINAVNLVIHFDCL